MRGLGTIINVAAVLVGSVLGMLLKGGLPERFEKTIKSAVGSGVIIIGLTGVLSEMLVVANDGSISSRYVMLMVFSLVAGGIAGELVNIEDKLERLGNWCKGKASILSKGNPKFTEGFVCASLLFCVGAMAIVGSLTDGLTGDYTTLSAKSVLDGIMSVVLAASYGGGVILSAITVGIYQGIITLLASVLEPLLTDVLISQMTMVGSVLIMGIGFNLTFDNKIVKVGNLLPAVIIPIFYQLFI